MQSGHRASQPASLILAPVDTKVTVARTSERDVQQRQLIVKLDGDPFATLMYGQTETRKIEAGRHRLTVDNTWVWKNLDFSVEAGGHAIFNLINRSGRLTWFLIGILGAGPMYITIERQA